MSRGSPLTQNKTILSEKNKSFGHNLGNKLDPRHYTLGPNGWNEQVYDALRSRDFSKILWFQHNIALCFYWQFQDREVRKSESSITEVHSDRRCHKTSMVDMGSYQCNNNIKRYQPGKNKGKKKERKKLQPCTNCYSIQFIEQFQTRTNRYQ